MTAEEVAQLADDARTMGDFHPPETVESLCMTVAALRARAEAAEADNAALVDAVAKSLSRCCGPTGDACDACADLRHVKDAPHPGTGYRAKVRGEVLRELAAEHREAARLLGTSWPERARQHEATATGYEGQAAREEQG